MIKVCVMCHRNAYMWQTKNTFPMFINEVVQLDLLLSIVCRFDHTCTSYVSNENWILISVCWVRWMTRETSGWVLQSSAFLSIMEWKNERCQIWEQIKVFFVILHLTHNHFPLFRWVLLLFVFLNLYVKCSEFKWVS